MAKPEARLQARLALSSERGHEFRGGKFSLDQPSTSVNGRVDNFRLLLKSVDREPAHHVSVMTTRETVQKYYDGVLRREGWQPIISDNIQFVLPGAVTQGKD